MKHILTLLLISLLCYACSVKAPEVVYVPGGEARISRGKYLVHTLAACGHCHGAQPVPYAPLSGGLPVYDSYGEVFAPNITPAESGIGTWSPHELLAVIRNGEHRERDHFSPDVHAGYEWLSENDVYSIIAYLNTQAPVEHEVEVRSPGILERNLSSLVDSPARVDGFVPSFKEDTPAYGRYLVEHVARCSTCHHGGESFFSDPVPLTGGRKVTNRFGEELIAPNIRGQSGAGLIDWTKQDLVKYLQTGRRPDGEVIETSYCPTNFYAGANDADLERMAEYLMGLN